MDAVMKCRAEGCTNDDSEGRFVKDYCAPCDHAFSTGTFSNPSTAEWHKLYEDNKRRETEIQDLENVLTKAKAIVKTAAVTIDKDVLCIWTSDLKALLGAIEKHAIHKAIGQLGKEKGTAR